MGRGRLGLLGAFVSEFMDLLPVSTSNYYKYMQVHFSTCCEVSNLNFYAAV